MNHLTFDSQKLLDFFFFMKTCYLLKRLQKLQRLLKLVGTKLLLEYFTLDELYNACTDSAVLRYWSNNNLSYKSSLTILSFWLQFIFKLFTFVYDLQFETFSLKRLDFKDIIIYLFFFHSWKMALVFLCLMNVLIIQCIIKSMSYEKLIGQDQNQNMSSKPGVELLNKCIVNLDTEWLL